MINVFISWSDERSKQLAQAFCYWLPRVHQHLKPWMSKEIPKGGRWQALVGKKLEETNIGILCVTPENQHAPWLLFEAGALSKSVDNSMVCPVLFALSASELDSPLNQFQATLLTKEDILHLLVSLNHKLGKDAVSEDILKDAISTNWKILSSKLKKISETVIPTDTQKIKEVISTFSVKGFGEPCYSPQAYFDHGYETYELYSVATQLAKKRLYMFGRKNRKLFDRTQYDDFFAGLNDRMADGFDFRILSIDPKSDTNILSLASSDPGFLKQLSEAIRNTMIKLDKFNIDPRRVCRLYSHDRSNCIMVIDDVVLCAPIQRSTDGKAMRITDSPFSIVRINNSCGESLLTSFEEAWSSSKPVHA